MLKKLPNALSNFDIIVKNNYVYIDKTKFIEELDLLSDKITVLLRPRRFGKTLFTEILRYYYDISAKEEADLLLKDTYISTHPTPNKNKFYVLKFDFSAIEKDCGIESIKESFTINVRRVVINFLLQHPQFITDFKGKNKDNEYEVIAFLQDKFKDQSPFNILEIFFESFSYVAKKDQKFIVIIDEYDNFTNDLIVENPKLFTQTTKKSSFLSTFYQVLRNNFQSGLIERIYITGVLPITLDSSISSFVYKNVSYDLIFNAIAGFNESQVRQLLRETLDLTRCQKLVNLNNLDQNYLHSLTTTEAQNYLIDLIFNDLKSKYNGYLFSSYQSETLFNPTLCLSYIDRIINNYDYQRIPFITEINDINIDHDKLDKFLNLINESDRQKILEHIYNDQPILFESIPKQIKIGLGDQLDLESGLVILICLGFLTFMSIDECKKFFKDDYNNGKYVKVPNKYVSSLFSRYYLDRHAFSWNLVENNYQIRVMEKENDLSGLIVALQKIASGFVNTDITHENESTIVIAIYTALILNLNNFKIIREYPIYHNNKVMINNQEDDQKIILGNHHRADLVALNQLSGPNYIFEFKYVRDSNSSNATKEKMITKLRQEAIDQLTLYCMDDHLKTLQNLHKWIIIYAYGKFIIEEAK